MHMMSTPPYDTFKSDKARTSVHQAIPDMPHAVSILEDVSILCNTFFFLIANEIIKKQVLAKNLSDQ